MCNIYIFKCNVATRACLGHAAYRPYTACAGRDCLTLSVSVTLSHSHTHTQRHVVILALHLRERWASSRLSPLHEGKTGCAQQNQRARIKKKKKTKKNQKQQLHNCTRIKTQQMMKGKEEERLTLRTLIGLHKVFVATWPYVRNIPRAQKTICLALC